MRRLGIFAVLMTWLLSSQLVGCDAFSGKDNAFRDVSSDVLKISGKTMGTQYHISWVAGADPANKLRVQSEIDGLLAAINASMSTYDPNSELSRLNDQNIILADARWQDVSASLYKVLGMAAEVYAASQGAFDVTVGPLVNLWGFGPDASTDQVPEAQQIRQRLAMVGFAALGLRHQQGHSQLLYRAPRYIDLSAIAKGYAVDRVALWFVEQGIDHFLVEIGGEVKAQGHKANGQYWRIAIEAPTEGGRQAQKVIELKNQGIATSGDYRNYFEQHGRRYSHTIDGRTGYPTEHALASVSVIHPQVALADAWATALMVLGPDKGLELAEANDLAAYFIVRNGVGFADRRTSQFEQLEKKEGAK